MNLVELQAFEDSALKKNPTMDIEGKKVETIAETLLRTISVYTDGTYSIYNKFTKVYSKNVNLIDCFMEDDGIQNVRISDEAKELILLDLADAKRVIQAEKLYKEFLAKGGTLVDMPNYDEYYDEEEAEKRYDDYMWEQEMEYLNSIEYEC